MDNEIIQLIRLLVKRASISLDDIMRDTNDSRRQIEYRLDKLNLFLTDHELELVRIGLNREFVLTPEVRSFLLKFLMDDSLIEYQLNRDERKIYIFLLVFSSEEYLSLQHFIQGLSVSKSTIVQDLKELSTQMKKENIDIIFDRINGYHIIGKELDIRRYMMNLVLESISDQRNTRVFDRFIDDQHLITYEFSRLLIQEIAQDFDISFVEDRLTEFIYIFILLKSRIVAAGHTLSSENEMPHIEVIKSFKEYEFSKALLEAMPGSQHISNLETIYIASWILGISVGDVEDKSDDTLVIGQMVGKIMTRFELLSGVQYDDSETIFRHVYSHFRPAYYRMVFKLPIFNPLKDRVKMEYSELYSLVKETMRPFSAVFGEEIPSEEIAYLTMHFASIYTKKRELKQHYRKTGIIICLNGVGSSVILYNELRALFPEIDFLLPIEVKDFNPRDFGADIVFTTQYYKDLVDVTVPIIKVTPILDLNDKYNLVRDVHTILNLGDVSAPNVDEIMSVIKNYVEEIDDEQGMRRDILNVLSNSTIQKEFNSPETKRSYSLKEIVSESITSVNVDAKDWKEAIIKSGSLLVNAGKVKQSYIDAILASQKMHISYLVVAPQIALPHSLPSHGTLECAIGITTLKNPVKFGNHDNDPVKYIFFLSALDNESHIPAMSELLDLFNDKCFMGLLSNAKNPKQIIDYINLNT